MRRPVIGALTLALAACAGEAEGPGGAAGAATRVDTVGGTVVVRNTGMPPAWRAAPLARIGSAGELGEAGPAEFGRVRSVVADDAGNVYVGDAQANEIRVFDPRGAFLRTLGGKGAGPREIGDLYSLAWLGDTLAVLDPRNARIGLFTRSGEWAGSWRWQPLTGTVRFLRAGDAAAYTLVFRGDDAMFARYTPAGATDIVPSPRWQGGTPPVRCRRPDGGISFFGTPFSPGGVFAFAPDGSLAVVPDGEYRIAFLGAGGDTVRVVEREYTRVPVGDGEWEEATRPYRELREQMPGVRCEGEMRRPELKPAIRHLLFDGTGKMWVESITPSGFAWDVFDPEGRLLGSVPGPGREEGVPPYVRNDRLYVAEADSLDVQYVTSYQVESNSPRPD